jgi:2-hydroxychromene-2-carboxylate isomerase
MFSAMAAGTLYLDLASPYAYLAAERAESVLGARPEFAPILLGAIFQERGHGSWAWTEARAENVAEIERRAAAYGLPPVRWPAEWPANSLQAMRAATWAVGRGAGHAFMLAAYRRAFAHGADLADRAVLLDVCASVGLDADALDAALDDPAIKLALRENTARAWALGVAGVPTLARGGRLYYGDDRLGAAA